MIHITIASSRSLKSRSELILSQILDHKYLNHLAGGIFISAELTLISISGRPVFLCFVFSSEISYASDSFSSSSLSSSLIYKKSVKIGNVINSKQLRENCLPGRIMSRIVIEIIFIVTFLLKWVRFQYFEILEMFMKFFSLRFQLNISSTIRQICL